MAKARTKKSRGKPKNDGKKLEQLVKLVEGMNLPDGFTVENNKKVFNIEGVQVAELDIVVTFKAGSVTYQTLFECRDRPSDGAAEVAWIEQLDGRRRNHNLSCVVAVSTTGFSPGAIDAAKKFGVQLRRVEQLTEEEIRGFLPKTAPMLLVWLGETSIVLDLRDEDATESEEPRRVPLVGDCIRNIKTHEKLSVRSLWRKLADNGAADSQMPSVKSEATIVLRQEHFADYHVEVEEKSGPIMQMTVKGTFQRSWSQMPLSEAVSYRSDDSSTTVATWKGGPEHGITQMQVILRKIKDV